MYGADTCHFVLHVCAGRGCWRDGVPGATRLWLASYPEFGERLAGFTIPVGCIMSSSDCSSEFCSTPAACSIAELPWTVRVEIAVTRRIVVRHGTGGRSVAADFGLCLLCRGSFACFPVFLFREMSVRYRISSAFISP